MQHVRHVGQEGAQRVAALAQNREVRTLQDQLDRRVEGRPLLQLAHQDLRGGQRLVELRLQLAEDFSGVLVRVELDQTAGEARRALHLLELVVVELRRAAAEHPVRGDSTDG